MIWTLWPWARRARAGQIRRYSIVAAAVAVGRVDVDLHLGITRMIQTALSIWRPCLFDVGQIVEVIN
jgi:hypothetical protein